MWSRCHEVRCAQPGIVGTLGSSLSLAVEVAMLGWSSLVRTVLSGPESGVPDQRCRQGKLWSPAPWDGSRGVPVPQVIRLILGIILGCVSTPLLPRLFPWVWYQSNVLSINLFQFKSSRVTFFSCRFQSIAFWIILGQFPSVFDFCFLCLGSVEFIRELDSMTRGYIFHSTVCCFLTN